MEKTEQRDKVSRFRSRAKNQQIKDRMCDTEIKLIVISKNVKECLLASGHATNTVAVNDLVVLFNKLKLVKKVIFITPQDINGNVYPPKAKIKINWFLLAF